jgi:hypothetical protein
MADILEKYAPALHATSDMPAGPPSVAPRPVPPPSEQPPPPAEQDIAVLDEKGVRAAAQRASEAASAFAALEQQRETVARPRRQDFYGPDEFEDALVDWTAQRAFRTVHKRNVERAKAEAEAQFASAVHASWSKRRAEAIRERSDWSEVAERADLPITELMRDSILRMPNGASVAYSLGRDPKEASRIARLSPQAQLVEMGALSARLAASPPPASPSGVVPRSTRQARPAPSESMDQYAARRLKELRG